MCEWKFDGWESFWQPEQGLQPESILLTTYGFDAEFLVSSLLPGIFGMKSQEGTVDWFCELEDNLKACPVHVLVDARQWSNSSRRSTLFQSAGGYVVPIRVTKGSQHAKLWMIKYPQFIRLAIGSCNLTRHGFQDEVQYIWMSQINRGAKKKASKNDFLSGLSSFLNHLLKASKNPLTFDSYDDSSAVTVLSKWHDALDACTPPKGAKIVPCIPSILTGVQENNYNDFGLQRIQAIIPRKNSTNRRLEVQVPFCGELKKEWLESLKKYFGTASLSLYWPNKENCPVQWEGMTLSQETSNVLKSVNANFYQFTFNENVENIRFPHGKLYAARNINDNNLHYILIGSCNLSRTAWEENFELNVLAFESLERLPFDTQAQHKNPYVNEVLGQEDDYESPFCSIEAILKRNILHIQIDTDIEMENIEFLVMSDIEEWPLKLATIGNQNCSCKIELPPEVPLSEIRRLKIKHSQCEIECPIIRPLNLVSEDVLSPETNYERATHEWILRRYGWNPLKKQSGEYRVSWVEYGMAIFAIIDEWVKSINNQQNRPYHDKVALEKAFQWFAENDADTQKKLAWKIAGEEFKKQIANLGDSDG